MTLKEKFKEILTAFWISNWEDECKKIADEFAIGFLQWVNENYDYYHSDGEYHNSSKNKWYKVEELLEIYKEEKEL
jgi:pyruvate-formate lyase-activating enzyme